MGLLGSALGRGLSGGGAAVAEIGNKYLDDQILTAREQVLADIRRRSTVDTAKDLDAYTNDPARRETMRTQAGLDTTAQAAATDQASLNTATNVPLMQAGIDRTNAIAAGTSEAAATAAGKITRAQADNTAHVVNPGDSVQIGAGKNNDPSAAQLHLDAVKAGLVGKSKEDRDRIVEAALKDTGDRLRDLSKTIDEGMAKGDLSPTKPPDGKSSDGYDRYTALLLRQRLLAKERNDIIAFAREQHGVAAPAKKDLGLFGDDKPKTGSTPVSGGGGQDEIAITKAAFNTEPPGPDKDAIALRLTQLGVKLDGETTDGSPGAGRGSVNPAAATPAAKPSLLERAQAAMKAPPADPPPPPDSPQAKYNAVQEKARAASAARDAENNKKVDALRQQFESDAASMSDLELVRKYDTERGKLTPAQLTRLKQIEKRL